MKTNRQNSCLSSLTGFTESCKKLTHISGLVCEGLLEETGKGKDPPSMWMTHSHGLGA